MVQQLQLQRFSSQTEVRSTHTHQKQQQQLAEHRSRAHLSRRTAASVDRDVSALSCICSFMFYLRLPSHPIAPPSFVYIQAN